jgi:ATP-dependent DNA helicase
VLKKATVYSDVLARQMDEKTSALRMGFFNQSDSSRNLKTKEAPSRKRPRIDSDDSDHEHLYQRKKARCDAVCDDGIGKDGMSRLKQPALVTGGKLKDYQLEGLEWMISLDQNGISGILGG